MSNAPKQVPGRPTAGGSRSALTHNHFTPGDVVKLYPLDEPDFPVWLRIVYVDGFGFCGLTSVKPPTPEAPHDWSGYLDLEDAKARVRLYPWTSIGSVQFAWSSANYERAWNGQSAKWPEAAE